jgi:hypothetical protein
MNNEFSENFRKIGHKYHIKISVVFQGALPNGGSLDKEIFLKKANFTAEENDIIFLRKTALPINKIISKILE